MLCFTVDSIPVNPSYVAKWDGTTWSELGTGTNALNADDWIFSVCSDRYGNIYTGGLFTDTSLTYIDSLDTSYYHPVYVAKYNNPALGIAPLHNIAMLNVYPNPTTNQLTISSTDKITTVTISNLLGQVVYSQQYNSQQVHIDCSSLPKGMYLVRINGSEVRKFVKQ